MAKKKRPNKPGFLEELLNEQPPSILDTLFSQPKENKPGRRPFEVICRFCGTQFPVKGLCPGCGATGEETAECS